MRSFITAPPLDAPQSAFGHVSFRPSVIYAAIMGRGPGPTGVQMRATSMAQVLAASGAQMLLSSGARMQPRSVPEREHRHPSAALCEWQVERGAVPGQ